MNNKDRFKFRTWYDNHYIYNVEEATDSSEYPTGDEIDNFSSFADIVNSEDCVVEQCTGLKDKNGKLIYENDLIECPNGVYRIAVDDFGLWTAIYENNPFKGVVEWSDIVKNYAFNQKKVEIEVLGNIHESADLIKVGAR